MLVDFLELIADMLLNLATARSEKKGRTFVTLLIAVVAGCVLALLYFQTMDLYVCALLALIIGVPVLALLLYLRKLK